MKDNKICFICSSGGHYTELSKLKSVAEQFNSLLVTEKVEKFEAKICKKNYFVREINRKEKFFFFHLIALCFKELFIFMKERPTHIITTGALCAYPLARIAKLFRKKIIYIESYARVFDLSATGKRIYKFADLFIVQWPELAELYDKAKFVVSLFGD